jgi:hypothetical protein
MAKTIRSQGVHPRRSGVSAVTASQRPSFMSRG